MKTCKDCKYWSQAYTSSDWGRCLAPLPEWVGLAGVGGLCFPRNVAKDYSNENVCQAFDARDV